MTSEVSSSTSMTTNMDMVYLDSTTEQMLFSLHSHEGGGGGGGGGAGGGGPPVVIRPISALMSLTACLMLSDTFPVTFSVDPGGTPLNCGWGQEGEAMPTPAPNNTQRQCQVPTGLFDLITIFFKFLSIFFSILFYIFLLPFFHFVLFCSILFYFVLLFSIFFQFFFNFLFLGFCSIF